MIKIWCIIRNNILIKGEKNLAESKPVDFKKEQPVLSPQGPTIPPPSLPHKWQYIQLSQRMSTFPYTSLLP